MGIIPFRRAFIRTYLIWIIVMVSCLGKTSKSATIQIDGDSIFRQSPVLLSDEDEPTIRRE